MGEERILQRQKELEDILLELDGKISTKAGIRIENKKIILSPLRAEELPAVLLNYRNLFLNAYHVLTSQNFLSK
jgi:hypothetical protein